METQREENTNFQKPETWKRPRKLNVTTTLPTNIWDLAKEQNVAWNEALEFGIKFLVAQQDGYNHDYPNNLLSEKLATIMRTLEAKSQECEALRDQINIEEKNKFDQEVEGIFRDGGKE